MTTCFASNSREPLLAQRSAAHHSPAPAREERERTKAAPSLLSAPLRLLRASFCVCAALRAGTPFFSIACYAFENEARTSAGLAGAIRLKALPYYTCYLKELGTLLAIRDGDASIFCAAFRRGGS